MTTDGRGLTEQEVERSRMEHGSNELTKKKRKGFFHQFISNFGDPIIKILLASLAINLIFLFRNFDWYETVGIAIAIFLATFVSTLSEHGSESAFEKLQEEAQKTQCRVQRAGGVCVVPASEVVVGDLVLLQPGERIPADGLLMTGRLSVDQSALNGESREVEKAPGAEKLGQVWKAEALASRSALLRGTVVCSGDAVMRVTAVGDRTFYGSLAGEVQEETRESPLKVRLSALARTLSRIGYCAAVLVALADLFHSILLDNGFDAALIAACCSDLPNLMSILLHALTLAITVVVVAVPEGLPMMITLVLSRNMRRMLKDNVLVRKLVGIETSGSLNVLFTDKTGTLTKGKLQVSRFVCGDGTAFVKQEELRRKPLWEMIELSCARNNESMVSGKKALGGNATDRALMEYVLPLSARLSPAAAKRNPLSALSSRVGPSVRSAPPLPGDAAVTQRVPFDSARKFSAVRLGGRTFVKGAPEKILSACSRYYDAQGNIRELSSRSKVMSAWNEMTGRAMRVLALAVSEAEVTEKGEFSHLILVGLLGIRDEVRPHVRSAVCQVHKAGVQVVMITGDNKDTAAAIARECGLLPQFSSETTRFPSSGTEGPRPNKRNAGLGQNHGEDIGPIAGEEAALAQSLRCVQGNRMRRKKQVNDGPSFTPVKESEAVITSSELAALSDEELRRRLPSLRVVARALPSDKSRLVQAAQELNMVAGMTGDGINDAPALKKADVGFAMGSGTEVAKEAGDIVILDDNFASITRAILYGRTIFKSIRKFITYQLIMNLCAVGVSIVGPFIGIDTPVTIMQMLWINIIMDTLGGLAFAGEPPLEEYMEQPPKRREEPVLSRYMLGQILCMGIYTVTMCVCFLKLPWFGALFGKNDTDDLMTAFFALFIFAGIFNCFNARTGRMNPLASLRKNPSFIVIMLLVATIQLVLIYFGGSLFRANGLSLRELARVLLIAGSVVPVDILRKYVLRKHHLQCDV